MSSRIVSAEGLAQMNAWILCHQAAGFGLLQHQPPRAVLVRPGRIKAGLPIFGRLFLWLPLIIYLARFAVSQDEVATPEVSPAARSLPAVAWPP